MDIHSKSTANFHVYIIGIYKIMGAKILNDQNSKILGQFCHN